MTVMVVKMTDAMTILRKMMVTGEATSSKCLVSTNEPPQKVVVQSNKM
jgi:hypothetical protein